MRELFARSEAKARHAANAAIADVQRLEARYSRYKTDNFLSKINRLACMEIDFGGVVKEYAVDRADGSPGV